MGDISNSLVEIVSFLTTGSCFLVAKGLSTSKRKSAAGVASEGERKRRKASSGAAKRSKAKRKATSSARKRTSSGAKVVKKVRAKKKKSR